MKTSEIRDLNLDQIEEGILDLKKTLLNLRFQNEIGQLENPKRILHVRREIAKYKTILVEKHK